MNPDRFLQHMAHMAGLPALRDLPPAAVALWYRDGQLAPAPVEGQPSGFWSPSGRDMTLYVGHALDVSGVAVLLYLPEGEAPEQRHRDDVAAWLATRPLPASSAPSA